MRSTRQVLLPLPKRPRIINDPRLFSFAFLQLKNTAKIKFDVEKINIPHFRVIQRKDEKIIVDNIGLVKALHVEERHKTF